MMNFAIFGLLPYNVLMLTYLSTIYIARAVFVAIMLLCRGYVSELGRPLKK
ncbi:hypothetical protein H6758_01160 [Candidatus Nomurabacteria bacterium]|nr:hypothetical protein [Candidatus Nomurabacteria bacterium]